MSNKAKVLKKYPKAWCMRGVFCPGWYVYKNNNMSGLVSTGTTAAEAWKAAAESLKSRKK